MTMFSHKAPRLKRWLKDPFGYISFWQLLTFVLLLLVIWINEIRDITGYFFQTPPQQVNIFRAFVLTAFVLTTAIVVIGNTYLQQKRILNTLITVCSKCHHVCIDRNEWAKIEDYVSDNSLLTFSHGLCPICMDEAMQTIEKHQSTKASSKIVPIQTATASQPADGCN